VLSGLALGVFEYWLLLVVLWMPYTDSWQWWFTVNTYKNTYS